LASAASRRSQAANDRGVFVFVPPPIEDAPRARLAPPAEGEDEDGEGSGVRLHESLYETAMKHELPAPDRRRPDSHLRLRHRLSASRRARRFVRDLLRSRRGDGRAPEVLFASLTVGGRGAPGLPLSVDR
jgi:hypothetical protein